MSEKGNARRRHQRRAMEGDEGSYSKARRKSRIRAAEDEEEIDAAKARGRQQRPFQRTERRQPRPARRELKREKAKKRNKTGVYVATEKDGGRQSKGGQRTKLDGGTRRTGSPKMEGEGRLVARRTGRKEKETHSVYHSASAVFREFLEPRRSFSLLRCSPWRVSVVTAVSLRRRGRGPHCSEARVAGRAG